MKCERCVEACEKCHGALHLTEEQVAEQHFEQQVADREAIAKELFVRGTDADVAFDKAQAFLEARDAAFELALCEHMSQQDLISRARMGVRVQ